MSNNITLSSYNSKDREWLSKLLVEQDVRKFLPHLTTDVDTFAHDMEIAERKGLGKFWIIRLDNIGVGFISIYDLIENPFIFYAMSPEFRNKGYMHNAIGLIEKEYSSILSTIVDANNVRSVKVLTNTTIKTKEIITL
ncbi:MAG: GNAT family N-acetyltransferase [Candidatus Limimorpha sp.]